MKCTILHESRGRMRVHVHAVRMTLHRADVLEAYLNHQDSIHHATVYERTGDVVLTYTGSRKEAIALLAGYKFDNAELDVLVTSNDSRKINREYQDKMFTLVAGHYARKLFLPAPIAAAYTIWRSIAFVWKGIRCLLQRKLEVEVLDALSISASILRSDFNTASSVMFLLNLGSLLEEWTRKKSLDDLARSMALNVDKVWVRAEGGEVLVPLTKVHPGDEIVVRSGNMIPLDGTVLEATYALTRNVTRAISILMVDFSCALKLSMPLAVLSAMRECGNYHITVKGGKYLEALAKADTIVFDKTGTLTHATPQVVQVVPFSGCEEREVLQLAACLEEHFPHSMANAVVRAARERGISHEEMHSEVEYIVAHGIASRVGGERVVIGSHHFVFEDEHCTVPAGEMDRFNDLDPQYSHLYMAASGQLVGVICIADPLRPEAAHVLRQLRELGISNTVMMTGDSDRTAAAIAKQVGVNQYFAEVLPEDKASFVQKAKAEGHTVVMIGDGINDSPALSAADIGIAINSGAAIAREIADVTIKADSLEELVALKAIANQLQRRVSANYHFVLSFNSTLIVLGAMGILQPATSAMLHNLSTIGISLKSMTNLLPAAAV